MPLPASAFPAGLVGLFDLAQTASLSGRRTAGPMLPDHLPASEQDSFDDLLSGALAVAFLNAAAPLAVTSLPAPTAEATAELVPTADITGSPERTSLLGTLAQFGRAATISAAPIPRAAEGTVLNQELGNGLAATDSADSTSVATVNPAANVDGAPEFADVKPAAEGIETAPLPDDGEANLRTTSVGPKGVNEPSGRVDSIATEEVMPEGAMPLAERSGSLDRRPIESEDLAVETHVVAESRAPVPIQETARSESTETDAERVESEADATALQAATERSVEGLRPVSEFAQDVQTVPQPETPVSSVPAAIAMEAPSVATEVIAAGASPAIVSQPSAAPQTSHVEAAGIRGSSDRSTRRSQDDREGTPDSAVFDVTASTDALTEASIESAPDAQSSFDAETSSEQGREKEKDADWSVVMSPGSSSVTGAPAPPATPEAVGSSVVQQISSAVQDWRAALQEQGTARFSAWLNPPNLGQVYVELTRSADGITARLSASEDGVQSVLESQGPELRQALQDAGIAVTELDVSGRSGGDAGSQQQQQPPPEQHESLEAMTWRNESQPRRRAPGARSNLVDVRV